MKTYAFPRYLQTGLLLKHQISSIYQNHTQNWKSSVSEKVNMITFIVNVIIFEYNDYALLPYVKMPIFTKEMLNSRWQHHSLVL